MTREKLITSRRGGMFFFLTFLALATSILLPSGTMLARDTSGAIRFTLCTGYGPMTTIKATPGKTDAPDDGKSMPMHHGAPCPYASGLAPLASLGSYDLPAPPAPTGTSDLVAFQNAVAPGRGMPAPPPPARAPPLALA